MARRWAWALEYPWVGLALDPEWRVGPRQVPAGVIGHVHAWEVNATSAWLDRLSRRAGLPEKLFVLHQFRSAMVNNIERVKDRPNLALVLHADGFGTRRQKLATYAAARPAPSSRWVSSCSTTRTYAASTRPTSAGSGRRVRFVSYQ